MSGGTTCFACDKKRAYMFEVGVKDSGLLACLYCVKAADCVLFCVTCKGSLSYTDGFSDERVEALCKDCMDGPHNFHCHKCGDELGYVTKFSTPFKAFCISCMGKVRRLKKRQ